MYISSVFVYHYTRLSMRGLVDNVSAPVLLCVSWAFLFTSSSFCILIGGFSACE